MLMFVLGGVKRANDVLLWYVKRKDSLLEKSILERVAIRH
jgi:hypothetical protein